MKENLINFIRISTYYPRIIIDKILFNFFLSRTNDWTLFKKFKNNPILIVANGPSLNSTPLDKINMTSIGMNKINLLFNKTVWRPEIIVCTNGLVLKQNKDFFNTTSSLLLVPVKAYYLGVKNRKNVFFLNLVDEYKINQNIEFKISSGCTVTFLALQIAAYLNPKSINLVGLDHSFKYKGNPKDIKKFEGDDANHFSKDYFKNQFWGVPDLEASEKLYKLSKTYFDSNNIPIFDCTIDGNLDVFIKKSVCEIVNN